MHSSPIPPETRVAYAVNAPVFPSNQKLLFALVTAVFFLWGMSNNLTDILVQQFRKSFELSLIQAQLVQTSVFLAYGTVAIPAALLMRRRGYKTGLITGLCFFAGGTLLFWPAAVMGLYIPFLVALFGVGCGSSILETAANPFIAQFGNPATSERRLNFAQAFNPPGCITGVFLGTYFIFSGVEKTPSQVAAMKASGQYTSYLHSEIMRVVPTYVGLGLAVLLLAFLVSRQTFPEALDETTDVGSNRSLLQLLRHPQLLFAVFAQFCYVGAQVGTWSTFIPYLKAYTGTTERAAGLMLAGTLGALAVGRIVSTPLMRFISPARMTAVYALVNVGLVLWSIERPGTSGGYALLASSFFMSIMFPTIFALGVKNLGSDTKLAGSLIVMAVVGGAIVPPLMGLVTRQTGSIADGYWLPLAGYFVVALYGLSSSGKSRGVSREGILRAPEIL